MKKPNSELYLPVFLRVWRKCRDSLPHIADSICTFHFLSLLCSFQENKQWGMMRKFKIVIRMFWLAWVNRESLLKTVFLEWNVCCELLIFCTDKNLWCEKCQKSMALKNDCQSGWFFFYWAKWGWKSPIMIRARKLTKFKCCLRGV